MSNIPPEEAAKLVHRFFNEVGIISQLSNAAMERVLPDGMTLAQFGVLNHFARLGGERTPARLAAAFQVTKGAMTNTLKRLEDKDYVSIKPDPADGRGKLVKLTAKGARAREKALKAVTPQLLQVADTDMLEELEAALPFLTRMRTYLDTARNPQDFPEDKKG